MLCSERLRRRCAISFLPPLCSLLLNLSVLSAEFSQCISPLSSSGGRSTWCCFCSSLCFKLSWSVPIQIGSIFLLWRDQVFPAHSSFHTSALIHFHSNTHTDTHTHTHTRTCTHTGWHDHFLLRNWSCHARIPRHLCRSWLTLAHCV